MSNSYESAIEALWSSDDNDRKFLNENPNEVLAYYTDASTAIKILESGKVWMRDARVMNDSSETVYGRKVLEYSISDKKIFEHLVSKVKPSHPMIVSSFFDNLVRSNSPKSRTFQMSLSHHNLNDDVLGRLSMWRGYGKKNGVALLVDPRHLADPIEWGGVYSTKIKYLDFERGKRFLTEKIQSLADLNIDWRDLNTGEVRDLFYNFFETFCISTKHPGFSEEREWRIYSRPDNEKSEHTEEIIRDINGVPQPIITLDFGSVNNGLKNVVLGALVGPSLNQAIIRDALVSKFSEQGYEHPGKMVQLSSTPWLSS